MARGGWRAPSGVVALAIFAACDGSKAGILGPSDAGLDEHDAADAPDATEAFEITVAVDLRSDLASPGCAFVAGELPLSSLVEMQACPATLDQALAPCDGVFNVYRTTCDTYVQVRFQPLAPIPGRTLHFATCAYAADTRALRGGWFGLHAFGEDDFPISAGEIPQNCLDRCAPEEVVCNPSDAGTPDAADALD